MILPYFLTVERACVILNQSPSLSRNFRPYMQSLQESVAGRSQDPDESSTLSDTVLKKL